MEISGRLEHAERLDSLGLDIDDYLIFGSGPLAIRGWRPNRNIDILVASDTWKLIRGPKCDKVVWHFERESTLELCEGHVSLHYVCPPFKNTEELIERGEIIDDRNYMRLIDLMVAKEYSGTFSDSNDIRLILKKSAEEELKRHSKA